MSDFLSSLAVPTVTALAGMIMLLGRGDPFAAFVRGAREGMKTALNLLPTLVALTVATSMLNACGILKVLADLLSPATNALGIPAELLPLLLTRPFSGGASTAALSTLLEQVGPDSLPGLCASVIFGSSDTLVYVISVYFSSVGIKRTRYTLPVAIVIMLFCVFFSCFLCRVWFF